MMFNRSVIHNTLKSNMIGEPFKEYRPSEHSQLQMNNFNKPLTDSPLHVDLADCVLQSESQEEDGESLGSCFS